MKQSSQPYKQFEQLLFGLEKKLYAYNETRTHDLRNAGAGSNPPHVE